MGLISSWNKIKNRFFYDKLYRGGFVFNQPQALWVSFEDYSDYYCEVPQIRSVISTKGNMFSNMNVVIKDKDDNVITEHPVLDLIKNPNPLQSQEQFLQQFKIQESLYGNAFIYGLKGSNLSQYPSALWNLPTRDMKVQTTGKFFQQKEIEDIIKEYSFRSGAIEETFDPKEILKTMVSGSHEYIIAESPIDSLNKPISNIIGAYDTRNVIINEKGAIGIFSNESKDMAGGLPVDPDERERLEEQYGNTYGVSKGKSRVIISEASLKWQAISFPTKDLLLFEEIEEDFSQIIDVYGMDRDLFSSVKGATFENKEQATKQTYQNTIQPEADSLMKSLTKFVGLEEGLRLVADYSWLPVFQEDESTKADVIQKKYDALAPLRDDNIITNEEFKNFLKL